MSTLADTGQSNLQDVMTQLRPDGRIEINFANTLAKLKPMIADMPFKQGILEGGDLVTSATALPSPTWRRYNQGTASSKGRFVQYVETCGMLTARPRVDADLAESTGDVAGFRMNQNKLHLEGLAQEAARAVLYQSVTLAQEKIHGIVPRYPATAGYTSSPYVLKSGTPASSNCRSIFLVSWDVDRVTGIYPKNTVGGLKYEDRSKIIAYDASNNPYDAYESVYKWFMGFEVKDYRYLVRLQWDPNDAGQTDSAKTLYLSLLTAINTVREILPSTVIYWDRATRGKVYNQLASNSLNYLQTVQADSMLRKRGILETFLGIPCRLEETIVPESAIS